MRTKQTFIGTIIFGLLVLGQNSCGGSVVGAPCSEDYDSCEEGCFNLDNDEQHCGDCRTVCDEGESCLMGICAVCPFGTEECDGECVDLEADEENCGGCGSPCGADEECIEGVCEGCPFGTELCGGECVDLMIEMEHCGECGNACDPGAEMCVDGECVLDCGELTECDGVCVDVNTDDLNCGECGNTCEFDEICASGTCELVCGDGLIACDDECVDPMTDRDHCGGCFNECGDEDICEQGECIPDCGLLTWCDDECVDIESDNEHCGECNSPCTDGWFCVAGECQLDCPEPLVACDDVCADLENDPLNCGECFVECESGICDDSECRQENVGHLIALGHDFSSSHPVLQRIMGNSIFMPYGSPVEVLAFDQYADQAPGGQVSKVDAAIDSEAGATGRTWTKTSAGSAAFVKDHLLDFDVFLVYVQSSAVDDELTRVGNELFSILRSFLGVGGVIIFTEAISESNSGTSEIFDTADLFACSGITDISGSTVEVVDYGDSVAQGATTTYMASDNSVYFKTDEETVVVQHQQSGNPVVIHKVFIP